MGWGACSNQTSCGSHLRLGATVLRPRVRGLPQLTFNATAGGSAIPLMMAQIWNHTFYWESLKPNGGGAPTGKLADAINASFGSYDEFKVGPGGGSAGGGAWILGRRWRCRGRCLLWWLRRGQV
jgi:hypothetical protein